MVFNKLKYLNIIFLFFVTSSFLYGQINSFAKNNFRIYPSISTQTEVTAVTHPLDENIIFASANTIQYLTGFFISEGIYVSTDGGKTWRGSDTCNGPIIQFHGGDPAITIDKDGKFILTHLGRTPFDGMYSHYSTDMGKNWSYQYLISATQLERANLASDVNPQSSFYGRSYCIWVELAPPYPIKFSFTTNGGVSWSSPKSINTPNQRCAGGEIALDEFSNIYVTWAVISSTSPYIELFAGFAKSTDGGGTWLVKEKAIPMRGIQGLLDSKSMIRVNGFPRIAVDNSSSLYKGNIYIVTTEKNNPPAGSDPDIILYRSTDRGQTFSSGIRVNQDELNNGKIQYFPAIHIDKNGGINIIYYDDRNTTSDSATVFLSRSTDGGNTFIDYQIADHNFKPSPLSGNGQGYQGDNIGLTSSNTTLIPLWMDNSSGIYQIWTNLIDLTSLNVNEDLTFSKDFILHQNYPNPFNPETRIEFEIPAIANSQPVFIELKIYDVLGREVVTLLSDYLYSGRYSKIWNAQNFPSGVYYYELKTSNVSIRKKMLLIK